MSKTCAEAAHGLVELHCKGHLLDANYVARLFRECSDFPQPKKTKQVWQWRVKYKNGQEFVLDNALMDEARAHELWNDVVYEKHAGLFEVDV